MAAPPPRSTGDSLPLAPSNSPSSAVSEDIDGGTEVKVHPNETAAHKNHLSEKPNQKDSSGEKANKMFELMVRLDPHGFLLFMVMASVLYVVLGFWFLWAFSDQPHGLFWNFSLLVCCLIFLWAISLSESTQVVMAHFSYVLLLTCSVTHFIGTFNGMLVMYIGTFYAAGFLGYTISRYFQRLGINKFAEIAAASDFNVKDPRRKDVGVFLLRFIISTCSLLCLVRIAWFICVPDTSERSLSEAFEFVIEIWGEICGPCGLWIIYVSQCELGGVILSMDTLAWAAPSFLCGWLFLGMLFSVVVGDVFATFFIWLGTMISVGFLGYILAVCACYKQIFARECDLSRISRTPTTKWAQRSDSVYLTVELPDTKNVKVKLMFDGHLIFSAEGPDDMQSELDLELFDAVSVKESKSAISGGTIYCLIQKAESKWWPRLLKKEDEPPVFLKVDLDKWQHKDAEDAGFGDFADMDFLNMDMGGDKQG